MSLDSRLDMMQEEALEMGRYYYKGFTASFTGILGNAELFLKTENREDLVSDAYGWLEEIQTHYKSIPFEGLHGKERFYPLFVINKLFPKVRETMDDVFYGKNANAYRNLDNTVQAIAAVGRVYWDSFQELLREIREYPGSRDFSVKMADHNNRSWRFKGPGSSAQDRHPL